MDLQSLSEKVDMLPREMHTRDEQIQASNHLQDDRFTQLMVMLEKLHSSVAGKDTDGDQNSGNSAKSGADFIHGNGGRWGY
jgi:hypothetical protein